MRRLRYFLTLGAIAAAMMASACTSQAEPDPTTSPLSPVLTPSPSSPTGEAALSPVDWQPATLGSLAVEYIEVQVYEPLVWTGLDWDGRHIWLANNLTHEIVALNRKGETVKRVPYPAIDELPANVTGVASAGDEIWVADMNHNQVYALETSSGQIRRGFDITGTVQGMDWDGQALWCARSSPSSSTLTRLNRQGDALARYELKGSWVTGIAWDNGRIWYVDAPGQDAWTVEVNSDLHQREIEDVATPGSFSSIAWTKDYLLLLDDMNGRLYGIPRDQLAPAP